MSKLITVDEFESFELVRDSSPESISADVLATVRTLHETEELEPYLRAILCDTNETPHGPAEVVDILTHRVRADNRAGICAFILKGKSFATVRPTDVSHQIYRLEKIADLSFAVLGFTGRLLDHAQEQFLSTTSRLGLTYAIFDASDLARLLTAYGFLCPRDGRKIVAGRCPCGYSPAKRFMNVLQREALRSISDAHDLQQTAGLVVLPPGSGKTRLAADDAKSTGAECVLYVAHTREILEVAKSEFEALFSVDSVTLHTGLGTLDRPNQVNLATI